MPERSQKAKINEGRGPLFHGHVVLNGFDRGDDLFVGDGVAEVDVHAPPAMAIEVGEVGISDRPTTSTIAGRWRYQTWRAAR